MFYDENDSYNKFLVLQLETMAYRCQRVIISICNTKVIYEDEVIRKYMNCLKDIWSGQEFVVGAIAFKTDLFR